MCSSQHLSIRCELFSWLWRKSTIISSRLFMRATSVWSVSYLIFCDFTRQVCVAAVGLVGDIARALGSSILTHCDHFMQILLENLAVSTTGGPSWVCDSWLSAAVRDRSPRSSHRDRSVDSGKWGKIKHWCYATNALKTFLSPKYRKLALIGPFAKP